MPFINLSTSPNDLPVVPLWINGNSQPVSEKDPLFPVISSVKDKPIHFAVSASPAAAVQACDSAATAFKSWRETSPRFRRSLLLKAADILTRRAGEIAESQIAETSCPEMFAKFNIVTGIEYVREIAAATSELRGTVPQRATGPDGNELGGLTVTVREPVGVLLIIPPYVLHLIFDLLDH